MERTIYLKDLLCVEGLNVNELGEKWVNLYNTNNDQGFIELIALMYVAARVPHYDISEQDMKCATTLFSRLTCRKETQLNLTETFLATFTEFVKSSFNDVAKDLFQNEVHMYFLMETLKSFILFRQPCVVIVGVTVGLELLEMLLHSLMVKMNGKGNLNLNATNTLFIEDEMFTLHKYFFIIIKEVVDPSIILSVLEIRKLCISKLTIFTNYLNYDIPHFSSTFFKLLGTFLNDSDDTIRLSAVETLIESTSSRVFFHEPSLPNVVKVLCNLALDSSNEIRVAALRCLQSIDRGKPDVIDKKSASLLFELVYNRHRIVATTAANFVHSRIVQEVGFNSINYLKELATFHIEAENDENDEYLIDALSEKSIILTDWESWITLLLSYKYNNPDYLETYYIEIIIRLLKCSIKQNTTGNIPFNRINKENKVLSESIIELNKREATLRFIEENKLSELCLKYNKSYVNLCTLLSCYTYLDFSSVKGLNGILKTIHSQLRTQTNNVISFECAKTYLSVVLKFSNCKSPGTKNLENYDYLKALSKHILKLLEKELRQLCGKMLNYDHPIPQEEERYLALSSANDILDDNGWNYLFMNINTQMLWIEDTKILNRVCFMIFLFIGKWFKGEKKKSINSEFLMKLHKMFKVFYTTIKNAVGVIPVDSTLVQDIQRFSVYVNSNDGLGCFIVTH